MSDILSIISPIFLIIAVGYGAVRTGVMERSAVPGIGRFVLYFALPALIALTLASTDIRDVIEPLFMLAYGLGSLATYGAAFVLFKIMMGNDVSSAGIKGLGASFSNSAFVGFPLLLQVFDDPPIAAFAMILVFENVVMMPLVLSVLEYGQRNAETKALKTALSVLGRLGKNPIILAIAVGMGVSLSGLSLPSVLSDALSILSKASAGAALFFIGASLAGARLQGDVRDITLIAMLKLILHPVLVAAFIFVLPSFDLQLQGIAVMFAAAPMFGIYAIIGERYGFTTLCSGALLVTTAASFVTITILFSIT